MSGYAGYPSPTSFAGAAGSPSMGPGYMSQEQSPAQSSEPRSVHILTPCSVRQLFNAKQSSADDVFQLDGHPLSQVTVVGQVMYMSKTETNITFEINDGSGSIPARLWVNPEEQQTEEDWREGSYVRVVGMLKTFNDQRSFVGSKVRKIENMNEITYHLAEIIKVHLYNTRGPLTEGENMQYDNSNQAYNTSNYSGYAAAPAGGAADNSLNDMVLRIIQAHHAEPQGVHINTILSDLERQGCPTSYQDTKAVIDSLEADGQVYGGAGEGCYKAVE